MRVRKRSWVPQRREMWAFGALVIAACLAAYSVHRFEAWRSRTGEDRSIAETVTVSGFTRTTIIDLSDGDNLPLARAFFIGPAPRPDPLTVVSVPNFQLRAADPPPVPASWEDPNKYAGIDYPAAIAQRPDGCYVAVGFDTHPKVSAPDLSGKHTITILTTEQLDNVLKGTQILIQLDVSGCPS